MKTLRTLFAILAMAAITTAKAQDNGMNAVYKVALADLEYTAPETTAIQENKPKIGKLIGKIAQAAGGVTTNSNHSEQVPAINAAVKSGISNVRRLTTIDSEDDTPDYELTGEITTITTKAKDITANQKDLKDRLLKTKQYEYTANIGVTLNLKNVATGEILAKTFSVSASNNGGSAADALTKCTNYLKNQVFNHYTWMFPLKANIIERGSANKKETKLKEAYIDLGSRGGLYEDQSFVVYVVGSVAGRETRTEVGKMKVKEVLGDDISLCKVTSGGKDIIEAFNAKKYLLVISE